MTTWLEDKNGNKCSVEYFGSKESAQTALDSLKNCENCIDCSDCSGCSNCHLYLVDADGKKLAAIWGKEEIKWERAEIIADAINAHGKESKPL